MHFCSREILHCCYRARGERVVMLTATKIGAEILRREIGRLFGKNCWPMFLKIEHCEKPCYSVDLEGLIYYDNIPQ